MPVDEELERLREAKRAGAAPDVFLPVVERLAASLYARALEMTSHPDESERIVGESFQKAWLHMHEAPRRIPLERWLVLIVECGARDYLGSNGLKWGGREPKESIDERTRRADAELRRGREHRKEHA